MRINALAAKLYLNPKTVYNALPRPFKHLKPWKHTHLAKAERKGKTPQQIQQLRFEKWARSVTHVSPDL